MHDTALLEPYVDEYFAMLRRVYSDEDQRDGHQPDRGPLPRRSTPAASQDLQDRADAWLAANEDAHDALKRLVIEGRDNVRRALVAQEADASTDWESVVE